MNAIIELLNRGAEHFPAFAWAMLWQSSLLIAIVFIVDTALRRKLRASIRYTLWMVVLLKLTLPPGLALPTGPRWWIREPVQPMPKMPAAAYTVTYGDQVPIILPSVSATFSPPPKPALSQAAWLMSASVATSVALLGWLALRWISVIRKVRMAKAVSELETISGHMAALSTLPQGVRLKLTADAMSPAVCGLFRPVILLPRSLADRLSPEQLQAVLLHETIHIRRGDIWVNCAQALLQIAYWWHPLLWLANARIRRVREEAVDDAVMLALRDQAEVYAPTLLEVAKFAFRRPLASLGLIGILESRSALRQRIERLVEFRAPRKAGLTIVSALGILAFTAVAVPMGEGPAQAPPPAIEKPKQKPKLVLIEAQFYRMRDNDFQNMVQKLPVNHDGETPWWAIDSDQFERYSQDAKASGLEPFARGTVQTSSGMTAQFYIGNTNHSIDLAFLPFIEVSDDTNHPRVKLDARLNSQGEFTDDPASDWPAMEGTNHYAIKAEVSGENGGGIILRARHPANIATNNIVVVLHTRIATTNMTKQVHQRLAPISEKSSTNSATTITGILSDPNFRTTLHALEQRNGVEISRIVNVLHEIQSGGIEYDRTPLSQVLRDLARTARTNRINFLFNSPADGPDPDRITVTFKSATGLPMDDLLNAIVGGADQPLQYSIQDLGVVFSGKDPNAPGSMETLVFSMSKSTFSDLLQTAGGVQPDEILVTARDVFGKKGVDLTAPGRRIGFNRLGLLYVTATKAELNIIKGTIEVLEAATPQVHMKARFIEVPKKRFALPTTFTNIANEPMTGILDDANFRTILRTLGQQKGVETIAEPEVVTTTGRQTQMRATDLQYILTNFTLVETITNSMVVPQVGQFEIGPTIDLVPHVRADGYTINLTAIPEILEFLGYETPKDGTPVVDKNGQKLVLPKALPGFRVTETKTTVNLRDNQTLVLGNLASTFVDGHGNDVPEPKYFANAEKKGGRSDKELIVFVTVTLVDAAGNRIHSDDDLPSSIPPQIK